MMDHWEEHGPPTHVLAAAYLGYKAPAKKEKAGTMEELLNLFPGGVING